MPERYAPGGPLALALDAVSKGRYEDALDRLEELLVLARGPDHAKTREHAARLAARIGLEAPLPVRPRAEQVARSAASIGQSPG